MVPDAPKMAMCRFSLVSFGIQTTFPCDSPRIVPSAVSTLLTSSTSRISLSLIQAAVP